MKKMERAQKKEQERKEFMKAQVEEQAEYSKKSYLNMV